MATEREVTKAFCYQCGKTGLHIRSFDDMWGGGSEWFEGEGWETRKEFVSGDVWVYGLCSCGGRVLKTTLLQE